jgi:hypothetical protein
MSAQFQRGPAPSDADERRRKAYYEGVKVGFAQAIDAIRDSEHRQPRWRWLRRRRLAITREALRQAFRNRWPIQ